MPEIVHDANCKVLGSLPATKPFKISLSGIQAATNNGNVLGDTLTIIFFPFRTVHKGGADAQLLDDE